MPYMLHSHATREITGTYLFSTSILDCLVKLCVVCAIPREYSIIQSESTVESLCKYLFIEYNLQHTPRGECMRVLSAIE